MPGWYIIPSPPEKLNEWISQNGRYTSFFGSRRDRYILGKGPSFWVYIHSFHSGGTNHLRWRQEEGEDGGHLLLIVLVREHEQRLKMPKDPVKKQHSVFRHFFFRGWFHIMMMHRSYSECFVRSPCYQTSKNQRRKEKISSSWIWYEVLTSFWL